MRGRVVGLAFVTALLIVAVTLPTPLPPAAGLGARSAQAEDAPPIVLTESGHDPAVAVDADGAAHVVWDEGGGDGPDRTHYCRVPRGATDCSVSHVFAPEPRDSAAGSEDFPGPHVLLSGGDRVVVLTHRCCGGFGAIGTEALYAVVSDDGGQTFGPPRVIGDLEPSGDAVLGADDRAYVVTDSVTGGTFFQAATLDGFAEDAARLGEGDQAYSGTVALVDGETPLVAFQDLASPYTTWYRLWSGRGDVNDAASWGPTTAVGPGDEPRLAGGPGGVWLLYTTGEVGDDHLVLRRFEGMGFGDPILVSGPDPIVADLAQDEGGRLHVIWEDAQRTLVYRVVTADGASEVLALTEDSVYGPRVAAAPDGGGWVVWKGSGGNDGQIVALPIEPPTDLPATDKAAKATHAPQATELDEPTAETGSLEVEGSGMAPTIQDGEVVDVVPPPDGGWPPARGDVVVFGPPSGEDTRFVKQVVGLPGEVVEIRDGGVHVDGERLAEDYVGGTATACAGRGACELTIPAGHVYVLGDNRPSSTDSRVFGPVPIAQIVGVVVL
jgi:signal peptidase I